MKKLACILLAVCFIFAFIGQANAYFEDGRLFQVIYSDTTTIEYGRDMGDIDDLKAAGQLLIDCPALLDPELLGHGYWMGYFGLENAGSGKYNAYFATTSDNMTQVNKAVLTFKGAYDLVKPYYAGLDVDVDGQVEGSTLNGGSYWVKMDYQTVRGQYATINKTNTYPGEQLVDGTFETMYVYQIQGDARTAAIIKQQDGTPYQFEVKCVPIPGALILLASGLLGLVGIKRRHV